MPSTLQLYRVFIASPGGLTSEREAFKETINEYNDSDAIERNALFLPVGWELTLAGIGRPQALINDDLMKCDYCILVLWDRWGTPPDDAAKYTSGTEEEFNIAMKCFNAQSKPMRQIVVLFKSVEPRQLSDPGPELRKVLEFKKKLESERLLLFDTFDEVSTFRKKLRRHLAAWTRDHESGELGKATTPRSIAVDPIEPATIDAGNITEERAPEDEAMIAKQVAVGNVEALQNYGNILALTQRIPRAREVFERLRALPQTAAGARILSLRQLGKIAQDEGSFTEAEELFKQALDIMVHLPLEEQGNKPVCILDLGYLYAETARYEEATAFMSEALNIRLAQKPPNTPGIAFAYYSVASNFIRQTRFKEAEPPSLEAMQLRISRLGINNPIIVNNLNQLATINISLGKLADSEKFLNSAVELEINRKDVSPSLIASTQVALGTLRRYQSRYSEAEDLLRQALSTREQQFGSDHRTVAAAASELAHVLEEKNLFSEAENLYRRALNFRLHRYGEFHPTTAKSYNSLGRLYMKQGALKEARQLFEKALKAVEEKLGPVTLTGLIKLNFGSLLLLEGDSKAREMLNSALDIFIQQLGEGHPHTQKTLDLISTKILA